jgi:[acyl-carrier-protein] S-malonyltransferase
MEQSLPVIAFIFPGQGSQMAGMGKELAAAYPVARQAFDEADEALGYKLSQLCFEGPDEQLRLTEITQPAVLTVSVAVYRVLESLGISPKFVAGHSLGEYSAHVAAGTIAFADAVRTVRSRGKYMQEAVPVGLVCQAANINSPDQIVIAGAKAAVERAAELCKQKGAKRAVMLPVSAPFHCPMLQPAQDRLAQDLRQLNAREPRIPVVCNVDAAAVTTAAASIDALIRQVTGAVQWERSVRKLVELGAALFVEAGPGKVLTGLMRQIDRSKTAMNVEDQSSLDKLKKHLESILSPAAAS